MKNLFDNMNHFILINLNAFYKQIYEVFCNIYD